MNNFDKVIDRTYSHSEKWNKELLKMHFDAEEILPFWIADMDFQTSPEIRKALSDFAFDQVFGYNSQSAHLKTAIINWHHKKFNWTINQEDIRFTPSILHSIATFINLYTQEGDGIIIQPPVFFQFKQLIVKNNREVVTNPLKLIDGYYTIDFEDLEAKASQPNNKILILCNPHNPVGRVWKKEELEKIHDICLKNNVFVISDEIHNGIIFGKNTFIPFSSISTEAKFHSLTCISPAKTFNIASVSDSVVLIANKELREKFDAHMNKTASNKVNSFNLIAMKTAYSNADAWLNDLLTYLEENLYFMRTFLETNIPQIKMIIPEGTFLVWLDFRDLELEPIALQEFLAKKAKVALNSGFWFGRQGAGFARMSIACPRKTLEHGLHNIKIAIQEQIKHKG